MKPIDVFENLMEPLRLELGNDSWEFLMKRGQIFIDQCASEKCTIPVVSGSLPLASGTVTKTRELLPTYHNKCDLCGEIFWTKDAFNNKCPECGREGWKNNDR